MIGERNKLAELRKNWNEFGRRDPFWAILNEPGKKNEGWNLDEFLKTGEADVQSILSSVEALPFRLRARESARFRLRRRQAHTVMEIVRCTQRRGAASGFGLG